MKLNKITLGDKKVFDKFIALKPRRLSVYAFTNIYIWKGLFKIYWKIVEGSLCVFFKDKIGCFMYLPPLAKKIKAKALREAFKIMDGLNKNKAVSRIENIEEEEALFYRNLGYQTRYKSSEYLCGRQDLTQLKGNRFKSKRSAYNYFIRHYSFQYKPFSLRDKEACLELYRAWMSERHNHNQDFIYQGMLKDSFITLKVLLDNYSKIGVTGRIVRVAKELKAFTFGFKINPQTFCILYEIADLSIKGLAQFIFREFCREAKVYKYINVMDDSGLENLKKVKLSYRPVSLVPSYIATKKNA